MKSPTRTLSLCCLFLLSTFTTAHATFHLMQVQQVIAGVDGDPAAQAIQLRMRAAGQQFVSEAQIFAWDENGSNPVVIMDFPGNVANNGAGVTILVASAGFSSVTTPAAVPDFTMTNVIPPSYLAAGSLTFESKEFPTVYWRLSWGGINYLGPTTGATSNDANGQFSPSYPLALPSSSDKAVLFQGGATALSTTNANDYAETAGAAVFTNNANVSFTVEVVTDAPPPSTLSRLRSWPNPFNPTTEIVFSSTVPEHLTLRIYDPRGRLVTTLFRGNVSVGTHRLSWDGHDSSGHPMASGVYLARLRGTTKIETHKLVLSK